MNLRSTSIALLVLALGLAACNSEETALSTTSSVIAGGPTTTEPAGPTTTISDSTPTTLQGQMVTNYERVARISTPGGDVIHIVIPAAGYTDVDLENFVAELKASDPELWGVEVFDDPAAAEAYAVAEAERTEEQAALILNHHLISVIEGTTVRYRGPFRTLPDTVLGS